MSKILKREQVRSKSLSFSGRLLLVEQGPSVPICATTLPHIRQELPWKIDISSYATPCYVCAHSPKTDPCWQISEQICKHAWQRWLFIFFAYNFIRTKMVTYCVTLPIFCVCLFLSDWKFLLVPSSWMANYVLCQRRRSVEGRRRKRGEKQTLCKRSQLVLTYSQDLSPSFQVPSIVVRLLIIVFVFVVRLSWNFCFPEFRMEAVIERFRRLHPDVAQVVYSSQSLTLHFFTLFEALTEYAATCSPWHLHSAKYYFSIPGHMVFWQGRLKNT